MNSPLCLEYFSEIGWKKVCRVKSRGLEWYYEDIDTSVMFSEHTSWIYVITVDGIIFKIGETGNPLGMEGSYSYDNFKEYQPQSSTKSRLGRYRKHDGTDENIRRLLIEETTNNNVLVEIWAHECQEFFYEKSVRGKLLRLKGQIHKSFEKELINQYILLNKHLPPGNRGRC